MVTSKISSPVLVLLFTALAFSTFTTSCKKKGCTDPKAINYNADAEKDDGSCEYKSAEITFYLDHNVDGNSLAFDKMQYTNKAGNKYDVQTLQYYISDVVLHRSGGSDASIDTVHYRDGRKADTRQFGPYKIANGTYNKITFTFGLDKDKNYSGYLPNTQTNNNMLWPEPMGGGYHYQKLEGAYIDSSGSQVNYNTHVGELDMNDTTQEQTIPKITLNLPSDIVADHDQWEVTLSMDINGWYERPHTYNFDDHGQGIMGNPEAQKTLKENAMSNLFSVTDIRSANFTE